ncbi:hypothetical protein OCU04_009204 [Sclerotinia nivalis]|uniref:Xylanolytic transcriptional activator regulatory domain-containing protein n=1 Tax=Sclerotinia nivalis TaxID=352851 RepID=A0A9X0AH31_9HELO|nr:hypothetical protein OCU04_009204 [Sclerotinia nivalis]
MVGKGIGEEGEDEGGDVAGLDSFADAAAMRDGDREEENEGGTKHTKTSGDRNRNADNITTSRHDSLGRIFTATAENQSTTKNPKNPSTTNMYRSSRGCVSPTPHHQSYIRPLPNFQDQTPGKATMQNNLNGTSYPRSRRYWGPTSFGAVFRDGDGRVEGNDGERNEKKVGGEAGIEEGTGGIGGMLDIGEDGRKNPSSWPFGQPLLGRDRPTSYTVRCEMITKALWNIPSRSSCNELLKRYHDIVEFLVMPEFMIQYLISSLFDTFGSILAEPRSKEKFIPFVETLLKNEETPLPPSPDDGIAWLNTFSGPNIRLEVMGLLFCFIGRAYQSLADENPLFQKEENHGMNRRQTSWRMNECADVMGKMCDCTDTVNEIVVAFRVAIFVLESAVVGDESYGNLNRHGDIVTSAFAIGLHRLPHLPPHLLTTAAEYKRRVFASVYQMDKCCSALNGTPPGISRLYCRVHTPSDLSETELFLPRAQMQQAIAECDEQGWNRKGEIYCGTWNRSTLPIYMVKEEILEGALAVDVQVSRERIDSLLARTASLSQNLPQQFSFNPTSTGTVLFVQLTISLETLQNKFLLHRLALANHLEGNYNQGLLDTAMEMLEKVIMMWEKRDKLMGFEFFFDWLVTSYGVPAAGVVCVELLKLTSDSSGSQKRRGKEKIGTDGDERRAKEKEKTRFSRSMAIQKLTLFAAFSDWVRDTDGNYALLKRVRGVVGRVLKWVLDGGEMSREVEKEKEKDISGQEDDSRMVNSQGTIDPARVQMEDHTTRNATGNPGVTDQGTQNWNMEAAVNFTPQLTQPSTTISGDFTANIQEGLDFNMNTVGLDLNIDLEGVGMEEMWGQVDWLNAGDWMGGGGAANGGAGFGFGF